MPDKTLTCQDCKGTFVFNERDQAHYASQVDRKTGAPWGDPKRCKPCRDLRKQSKPKQDMQTG